MLNYRPWSHFLDAEIHDSQAPGPVRSKKKRRPAPEVRTRLNLQKKLRRKSNRERAALGLLAGDPELPNETATNLAVNVQGKEVSPTACTNILDTEAASESGEGQAGPSTRHHVDVGDSASEMSISIADEDEVTESQSQPRLHEHRECQTDIISSATRDEDGDQPPLPFPLSPPAMRSTRSRSSSHVSIDCVSNPQTHDSPSELTQHPLLIGLEVHRAPPPLPPPFPLQKLIPANATTEVLGALDGGEEIRIPFENISSEQNRLTASTLVDSTSCQVRDGGEDLMSFRELHNKGMGVSDGGDIRTPTQSQVTLTTTRGVSDEHGYTGFTTPLLAPLSNSNGANDVAQSLPREPKASQLDRKRTKRRKHPTWRDSLNTLDGTVIGRNAYELCILSEPSTYQRLEQRFEPLFGYSSNALVGSKFDVPLSIDPAEPATYIKSSTIYTYEIGDFIVLSARPGNIPELSLQLRRSPASLSINIYADVFWFGRIIAFRKEKTEAHVQWAVHASKTTLQETHHPREVFLTFSCDWVPTTLFVQPVPVDRFIQPTGPLWSTSATDQVNRFYCRFAVDETDGSFHSIPRAALGREPSCISTNCCEGTASPVLGDRSEHCQIPRLDGLQQHLVASFRWNGDQYHEGDFVYLFPRRKAPEATNAGSYVEDLLIIAQLVDVGCSPKRTEFSHTVKVRIFRRKDPAKLSRRLVLPDNSLHTRNVDQITGKCIVITTEEFEARKEFANGDIYGRFPHLWHVDRRDLEQCDDPSSSQPSSSVPQQSSGFSPDALLKACVLCCRKLEQFDTVAKTPLRHMDVFSGVGGFAQGFARTGSIDVKAAIDISPTACSTFQTSYPGAKVICDDINNFIVGLGKIKQGKKTSLKTIYGEKITDLPQAADIDSMTISPPSTEFDDFQDTCDPKVAYVVLGLALVEFYKPDYVAIETTSAMARDDVEVSGPGPNEVKGKIKWGIHKFILRTLLDLGYQIRSASLDAADYGTPSASNRVIYIAARHFLPSPNASCLLPIRRLPQMPRPTHVPMVGSARVSTYNVPGVDVKFPGAPGRNPDGSAAHLPVKVKEALEDLPKFDWCSDLPPRSDFPIVGLGLKTDKNRKGKKRRSERWGLDDGPYAQGFEGPVNDYQRWVRAGSTFATHTFTRVFGELTTKRITYISMAPGANHTSLSKELEIHRLVSTTGPAAKNNLYPNALRRLAELEQFQPPIAVFDPRRKQGRVLHPNQRRVLTAREYARAQGISDITDFQYIKGNEADCYAQIGNAIPVPLSMAIARSIVDSLFETWLEENHLIRIP